MSRQHSVAQKASEPQPYNSNDSAKDLPNIQSPITSNQALLGKKAFSLEIADSANTSVVAAADELAENPAGAEAKDEEDRENDDESMSSISSGGVDLPRDDSQGLDAEDSLAGRSGDDDLLHIEAEDEGESDIFDTDSSADEAQNVASFQPQPKPEVKKPPELEEEFTEVMGGILVYDSHAHLKGCKKIEDYWESRAVERVHMDALFTKQEVKEVTRDLFQEKARERDFATDNDKATFKNLPRFQPQRDFINLQYTVTVPNYQNILIFDSRFESGNLLKVAKVSNVEYNLWLENDVNTRGNTQWYYFKVVYKDVALLAEKRTHKIKFNILNLAKTSSLYQQGMKPVLWSRRRHEEEGVEWFRGGENITYKQNTINRFDNEGGPPKVMKAPNNFYLLNQNPAGEGVENYHTLSFTYEFVAHQDDEVTFCHAVPYTFSHMQEKIKGLISAYGSEPGTPTSLVQPEKTLGAPASNTKTAESNREQGGPRAIIKKNLLCTSLGKIPCPLLTITEKVDTYLDYYEELRLIHQIPNVVRRAFREKYRKLRKLARTGDDSKGRAKRFIEAAYEEEIKDFFEYNKDHLLETSPTFEGFDARLNQYLKDHGQKKAIIITSRVHPGEPQASHMLDGLLQYLLSKEAEVLRKHFVVRIVPMLNPDGVIYGNYRCSLLGVDLNRKWEKPNRFLHPTVFHAKNLIRHMHAERKVVLFTDLHGHSRKLNAFFYGCSYKNYEQEGRIRNAQLRIVPLLCCQKNGHFSTKDSRFGIEKCKEATARVTVFKEFGIMNSFTLECSFFGKEWTVKTESSNAPLAIYGRMPPPKSRISHMTLEDYRSMGETLIQTMHNFLPGEQHKLQIISGKILDVFYEEFIKFIPPYILKREEEKRRKAEGFTGQLTFKDKKATPATTDKKKRKRFSQAAGIVSGSSSKEQRGISAGLRIGGKPKKGSTKEAISMAREIDRNADRKAATRAKLPQAGKDDESSDQKIVVGLSGNDEENFDSLINIPNKQHEIMEFDSFMNGIQHQIEAKQERKRRKLDKLLDGIVAGKGKVVEKAEKTADAKLAEMRLKLTRSVAESLLEGRQLDELISSDSPDNTSSDEETYQQQQARYKRRAKQRKQLQKLLRKARAEADGIIEKREKEKIENEQGLKKQATKTRRKLRKPQEDKDKEKGDDHKSPRSTSRQRLGTAGHLKKKLSSVLSTRPDHARWQHGEVGEKIKVQLNAVSVGQHFINQELLEQESKAARNFHKHHASKLQRNLVEHPLSKHVETEDGDLQRQGTFNDKRIRKVAQDNIDKSAQASHNTYSDTGRMGSRQNLDQHLQQFAVKRSMLNVDSDGQIAKGLKASRTNHRYLTNVSNQELSSAAIGSAMKNNRSQAANNARSSGPAIPPKSVPSRAGKNLTGNYDAAYSMHAESAAMRDYETAVLATGFQEMPLDETADLRNAVSRMNSKKSRIDDIEDVQASRHSRTVNQSVGAMMQKPMAAPNTEKPSKISRQMFHPKAFRPMVINKESIKNFTMQESSSLPGKQGILSSQQFVAQHNSLPSQGYVLQNMASQDSNRRQAVLIQNQKNIRNFKTEHFIQQKLDMQRLDARNQYAPGMTPQKRDAMSQQMLITPGQEAIANYYSAAEERADQVVIYRNRNTGLREKQTIELDHASLEQPKPTIPVVILRKPGSSKSKKPQYIIKTADRQTGYADSFNQIGLGLAGTFAGGMQQNFMAPGGSQPVTGTNLSLRPDKLQSGMRPGQRGVSQIQARMPSKVDGSTHEMTRGEDGLLIWSPNINQRSSLGSQQQPRAPNIMEKQNYQGQAANEVGQGLIPYPQRRGTPSVPSSRRSDGDKLCRFK